MKIIVGEWFWIPRVGGEAFRRLVKDAGLKYDKSHGFQATSETDLSMVISILKGELNEDIEVSLNCFVCGRSVECGECTYRDICNPTRISQACICRECQMGQEAPTLYAIRFAELSSPS